MTDRSLTKQEKTCARCEGTGSIEPAWPVGPGGGRIEPYKCAACGGTGKLPISRPVMNPPVDEAEAGNRANTAPRQADPDAPCRGETGVSSGSEARPVTATELLSSNLHTCPDCRNQFVQPFVCTTCGAQKLYDETVRTQALTIERLRAALREWIDKTPNPPEWHWSFDLHVRTSKLLSADLSAPETTPDFRGLLEEMWKFWGRPREEEFIDAGVSVEKGMDLYCRVSAALGDPVCAKCDRRFSQHKTVISHDFTHRPPAQETPATRWVDGSATYPQEKASTGSWVRGGNSVGTGLQGYIHVPYSKVVEVFGEPEYHGNKGDSRVIFEWVMTFTDGTVVTIYDYKQSKLYGDDPNAPTPDEMKALPSFEWHIGGKNHRAVELVQSALNGSVNGEKNDAG